MHHPRPAAAPQRFAVSLAAQSPFTSKGLRSFWEYRDLGVADGTHGQWKATVLRTRRPCPPQGTGWHRHTLDFQLYYILRGAMTTRVEGREETTFRAGDSFLQPPRTLHNVVGYTDDLEMLELVAPADFGTEESAPPPDAAGPEDAGHGSAQRFVTSFAQGAAFESGGLRAYFAYRDLGTREGSQGLVQAHVLRAVQPCPPGGTGWHCHEVDFQMVFVLQGEITTELEGQGERTFTAGDSWTQPPAIRHCVKAYSDDLEMIEIISPADFRTRETEAPLP